VSLYDDKTKIFSSDHTTIYTYALTVGLVTHVDPGAFSTGIDTQHLFRIVPFLPVKTERTWGIARSTLVV
jgi:hypothetical protein